jgi:hypothetical protein
MTPRIALAALFALVSGSASAEIVTIRYDFTGGIANRELMWGYFGGERGPTTGRILSTTLVITDYTTTGTQDAADFYFTFDVPTDSATQHIGLTGTELAWSGLGSFSHALTSDAYNGQIREGRFASESSGGGEFVGDTYVEFLVDADPLDPIFADAFEQL